MLNLLESFNGFSDGDEIGIEKGVVSDGPTVHYIAYVPHSSHTKNTNHSFLLFVLFIFSVFVG
jgi:hypothetical protein